MNSLVPKEGFGAKRRRLNQAIAKEKATEKQWEVVRMKIEAWISAFPSAWFAFQQDLIRGRNTYAASQEKGLKQARWRNTAAFPIAYRRDEFGLVQEEPLLPAIEKIIPGLTNKHSKNFAEFLKRFPAFSPADRTNTSTYADDNIMPYIAPMKTTLANLDALEQSVTKKPKYPTKDKPVKVKKKNVSH